MNNAVNALDRQDRGLTFLQPKLPRISFESFRAEIYDGPQQWELRKNPVFDDSTGAVCLAVTLIGNEKLSSKQMKRGVRE